MLLNCSVVFGGDDNYWLNYHNILPDALTVVNGETILHDAFDFGKESKVDHPVWLRLKFPGQITTGYI